MFAVNFVVYVVCVHNSAHILAFGLKWNLDPPVDDDVMEDEVENAI